MPSSGNLGCWSILCYEHVNYYNNHIIEVKASNIINIKTNIIIKRWLISSYYLKPTQAVCPCVQNLFGGMRWWPRRSGTPTCWRGWPSRSWGPSSWRTPRLPLSSVSQWDSGKNFCIASSPAGRPSADVPWPRPWASPLSRLTSLPRPHQTSRQSNLDRQDNNGNSEEVFFFKYLMVNLLPTDDVRGYWRIILSLWIGCLCKKKDDTDEQLQGK